MELSERRRHPRYVVMLDAQVAKTPDMSVTAGILVECSAGGGVVEARAEAQPGDRLAVRFVFDGQTITLRSTVIRTIGGTGGLMSLQWHRGYDPVSDAALDGLLAEMEAMSRPRLRSGARPRTP